MPTSVFRGQPVIRELYQAVMLRVMESVEDIQDAIVDTTGQLKCGTARREVSDDLLQVD